MPPATLVLASLVGLASAALYAGMGARILARARLRPERAGLRYLATFWIGVAGYGLVECGWHLSSAVGGLGLAGALVVLQLKIVSALAGFFGLVAYLALIYTGKRAGVAAAGAYYAIVYVVVELYYAWRHPIGDGVRTWGRGLDYARDGGVFADVVVLLMFAPPVLAALLYARLYWLVDSPAARWRAAWTAGSLLAFFVPLTLGWIIGSLPWWGLAEKLLGFAAACGLLAAEAPPARWRDVARGDAALRAPGP